MASSCEPAGCWDIASGVYAFTDACLASNMAPNTAAIGEATRIIRAACAECKCCLKCLVKGYIMSWHGSEKLCQRSGKQSDIRWNPHLRVLNRSLGEYKASIKNIRDIISYMFFCFIFAFFVLLVLCLFCFPFFFFLCVCLWERDQKVGWIGRLGGSGRNWKRGNMIKIYWKFQTKMIFLNKRKESTDS